MIKRRDLTTLLGGAAFAPLALICWRSLSGEPFELDS
jgi:hypothetical protein